MAELSTAAVYRTLISSRLRSQLAYRSSFALSLATAMVTGAFDFIEIYVVLHNVPVFGGLDFAQASLVFALSTIGFAAGDMVFGQLDTIPTSLRMGRLEVLLVRPMPLLLQLVTADFQLRRLGRMLIGVVILIVTLTQLQLPADPKTIYLLVVTPLVGAAIFGAFFTTAGGLQFFVIDGAELTASFVYGGSYASQLPGSVLLTPIRVLFTFVFPATAVAYLPTLLILGLPGPAFLPAWLGWTTPVLAGWAWLIAAAIWRAGTRRFVGAGG